LLHNKAFPFVGQKLRYSLIESGNNRAKFVLHVHKKLNENEILVGALPFGFITQGTINEKVNEIDDLDTDKATTEPVSTAVLLDLHSEEVITFPYIRPDKTNDFVYNRTNIRDFFNCEGANDTEPDEITTVSADEQLAAVGNGDGSSKSASLMLLVIVLSALGLVAVIGCMYFNSTRKANQVAAMKAQNSGERQYRYAKPSHFRKNASTISPNTSNRNLASMSRSTSLTRKKYKDSLR